MKLLIILALFAAVAGGALGVWRAADYRADRTEWARLTAAQPAAPKQFDPAMVAELPDPARRYFTCTIRPGTPLFTVAEIEMTGRFSLGSKEAPNYLDMRARQILAAPEGFVWAMEASGGAMRVAGSDSGRWTRFWLWGIAPVARGDGEDHRRSAFGRTVAEAAIWTPAALLPSPGVRWDAVSADRARVTVTHEGLEQAVEITIDDEGCPHEIRLERWSDVNSEKTFRLQPFGGRLLDFAWFDGFRLPTRVEAGNHFGTERYYPFFIADVAKIRFPKRLQLTSGNFSVGRPSRPVAGSESSCHCLPRPPQSSRSSASSRA
ncbi:DUF6544 family protein [Tranquillimonas alkanivorans]|uniref:Uncharacterized protein n=1 Tax=Tranquillimonas alkanivorans TaxID=441119 RepID=A0A1I5U7P2_9RHOB|nr:DUF6544 family protein [Tranquillimonas alkanivorans]SFP91309.1 hypothetical protein SAMN04488047_11824 [Tranquillimonas alkanivorans]